MKRIEIGGDATLGVDTLRLRLIGKVKNLESPDMAPESSFIVDQVVPARQIHTRLEEPVQNFLRQLVQHLGAK